MKTLILVLLFLIACSAAKSTHHPYTRTTDYTILDIDSTENYFILKGEEKSSDEIITLVVEKKSKQLKKKNISVNKNYTFSTYSVFDEFFVGDACHEVEGKLVWCSSYSFDLRFTDSMGNEIMDK